MKRRIAVIGTTIMMTLAAAWLPVTGVYADEAADQAAAAAAVQAAAAQTQAEAIDLRGLIGKNPTEIANQWGGFSAFPNMVEGAYYTNGAIEFWGNDTDGIRSVQFLSATPANIAGVTFGMNFNQASSMLQASGWTHMRTGGKRAAFRDASGNLLSLAFDKNKSVFWVNYLKIY